MHTSYLNKEIRALRPGGTPSKYMTGMYDHIDPHFQTSCNWMTPFLFFTFCSHQMTPFSKCSLQTNIGYISRGGHLLVKVGVIHWEHVYIQKGTFVRAFYFFKMGSLKGHWTSITSFPNFFPKKVGIVIPLEVLAWVMTAGWVLLSRLIYF